MQNATLETRIEDEGGVTIFTPWSVGYENLNEYIKRHNESIREAKKNGEVLPPDAKIIRNGLRTTIERILRLYINQLAAQNRLDRLTVDKLPPFRTYTPSLATGLQITDKTIQNHRRALVQAGIIAAEENHGAKGIWMWLNPTLFIKDFVHKLWAAENSPENNENMTSQNAILSPFPTSQSTETKNLHPLGPAIQDPEENISDVDKGMLPHSMPEPCPETAAEKPQPEQGTASAQDHTSVSGKTTRKGEQRGDQLQPQPPAGGPEKNEKNCAAAGEPGGGAAAGRDPEPDERQLWLRFTMAMVEDFWLFTKQRLYPHKKFVPLDEKLIKNFIWRNVFGGFRQSGTHNQYRQYLKQCKERIDMAHNYLLSHPGFSILEPDLYFGDQDIQGSFHRTAAWYQNKQRSVLMAKIHAEAEKFRKGKLVKKYKGNKYKPTIHELYQDHCQYLQRFGSEEMLEQFQAFIAQNPSYYAGYAKVPKQID